MADDAGHKAMLYFLEILMNSPAPLTISQLAGRFGSRNFTSEMRQAAGGNETGLKKFLQKYPSLFTVNGNLVIILMVFFFVFCQIKLFSITGRYSIVSSIQNHRIDICMLN